MIGPGVCVGVSLGGSVGRVVDVTLAVSVEVWLGRDVSVGSAAIVSARLISARAWEVAAASLSVNPQLANNIVSRVMAIKNFRIRSSK